MPSKVTTTSFPLKCDPRMIAIDPGDTAVTSGRAAFTRLCRITLGATGGAGVTGAGCTGLGNTGAGGGKAVTVTVMGSVWLPACGPPVMNSVALYMPGARFCGKTFTSTVPPFTPAEGLMVSHPLPVIEPIEAVQLNTPPPLLFTCTVLVCRADPAIAVNCSGCDAVTDRDGK